MANRPKPPTHDTRGTRDARDIREWTVGKLLAWTTRYFETHLIDSPRTTAEMLLAHALGQRRIDLYLQHDKPLNSDELVRFKALIKRRSGGEPVAYIVGGKGFWSLDLVVDASVLIPRPETECMVEAALLHLSVARNAGKEEGSLRILDLGTGSGAVVLALASEKPEHRYFASDISMRALSVARENALRHHLQDNVAFFAGNWFSPLPEAGTAFHLILSNPPYIPSAEIGNLQPEIRRFEPIVALDGDEDGLGCLRHLIHTAPGYLENQGHLLLEIGAGQKAEIEEIANRSGQYDRIAFFKDYGGCHRVVQLRKKA